MEVSGSGKAPNTSLSFRYKANNEELEQLFQGCDDDPPTPQPEPPTRSESASPKKSEKSPSIIDKYFKSMRTEKAVEKVEDVKAETKTDDKKGDVPKEVTSSPMKEYLNRLGKRSTSEVVTDVKDKEANETWKIFHDFKFKIAQAVEDMKTRSVEEKDKSLPRENSTDSEDNSAIKDSDQQSMGDTDNQVSSLDSSIQNLSEVTQPLTAKPTEADLSKELSFKSHTDSSDDTHKNLARSDSDLGGDLQDSLEVESGVEALEDTIDAFGDVNQVETDILNRTQDTESRPPSAPANFGLPPSKNNLHKENPSKNSKKTYIFTFSMYFLTIFLIINYLLFPNCNIWIGFWLGIWFFCLVGNVKDWVLDTYFSEDTRKTGLLQLKRTSAVPFTYTIPSVKEHRPLKKYEGWINHYRYPDYDPQTYHINKTTTAFVKLEGCNLRISYTSTKIAKRALWDEKIEKITFYQHRLYNLTGARVIMLPYGLVKRRQWSKKYPICVILNEREKIQVLEKENAIEKKTAESTDKKSKDQSQEMDIPEINASPEKKKKFVWRRRERSISRNEGETGKEGLRHRIVRKMHRDKKADSTLTSVEPEAQGQSDKNTQLDEAETEVEIRSKEDEEELDDSELTKIKEFLEESENDPINEGTAEGEWSIHVKQSRDKHSRLFLFARTGRDKHEWYRRLVTAVSEANASQDNSSSDDRSGSDTVQETKDGVELTVYKFTEKDTVAFAKSKTNDSITEGVTITTPSHPVPTSVDSYEKSFWPYLQKIIQTQSVSPDCACRSLPAEATWVNSLVARLMYDVMRDPKMVARVQNKIQRKLNTMKLPSFMSPLIITELRLAGACPLLGGVGAPTCDTRGLWLHSNLRYDGGATITILTQINLMKLKEKNVTLEDQLMETNENVIETEIQLDPRGSCVSPDLKRRKPAIYDSDAEDSAESSSDDESPPVQPVDSAENMLVSETNLATPEGGSSKKKFLRMVDKIATNKYFQQVTDYKYVKRAMEGLSNTDIKLQLEVNGLEGRLAINLPPPPHDRLWIGFSTNPQLVLKARPAVGARALRFAHISNWIEQKLTREFEKVLVLPNMEDIIIDVLTPTPVEFQ
ncbi:testis-expressed protein 2 [Bicyclus anynana]|uniref:Testis-expressed protein 2 n=1 Tax=Bicyclus anynana TaxID=110368 RepID=A0ABM3LMB7_BICAN|nr:testis-expressed protein 2 [Bicyclus anynana]